MSNPINIPCPADQWTKVITDNTSGTITKVSTKPHKYLYARRDTGDAAPVGVSADGAASFFLSVIVEGFGAKSGSDAYIYPIGFAGEVSVDI